MHLIFKVILILSLCQAIPYPVLGQMEVYSSYQQPAVYEIGTSSTYGQAEAGLSPASGYHMQRSIEIYQTGQTDFEAFVPNQFAATGQVGSDGTVSSYPNVGSSGNTDFQAFLAFDISSIPDEATIRSAVLEFDGCDVVGSPFSSLGCMKIYPIPYREIGSRSYSSLATYPSCVEVCSSGQLNSPLSSLNLAKALQSALGTEKLQLGLQFERGGTVRISENSPTQISYNYPSSSSSQYSGYGDYSSSGSSSNYLSDPVVSRQTMEDMGVDVAFLQSENGGKVGGSNPRYILLTPDANLTELGIPADVIEKAIDPGRVSISSGYMNEEAWEQVLEIPDLDVDWLPGCNCPSGETYDPTTDSCVPVGSGSCPEGYCQDSDGDGVCDLSQNVIGVAHIGWLSRDPAPSSTLKGSNAEYGRSVEDLTGVFSGAQSCCKDFNGDGYCDLPEKPTVPEPSRQTTDLIKIGLTRLLITYTLPEASVSPSQKNPNQKRPNERVRKKLGYCRFEPPDPVRLINASSVGWGEVPSNQVLVQVDLSLNFQEARIVARQLADALGGQVVGELEYTNLFQIETQSQSIEELIRDISNAEGYPSVSLASPNQQVFREAPLEDSIYRGKNGKGFQMIGVEDAWKSVHDSGIELSEVYVGVTDDGLYKGYNEFDRTEINTSMDLYDESPSLLIKPLPGLETAGSHGTGVMNILAADADDGGLVGIASEPLQGKLKVDMISILSGDRFYITTSLQGLKTEIENGCNILSCSWGNSDADPRAAEMYENWFKKLWNDYPDILFICSAGNDGGAMETNRRIPNGLPNCPDSLPNVLTVGNILNDGEMCPESNRNYHNNYVSLAAPGEEAVWGMNSSGQIYNSSGGTSMAVPHVTATAALIRSIDPSLNAEEIKEILTETGRSSIEGVDAPEDLGGKVLAADMATERAITDRPPGVQAPKYPVRIIEIPIYKGDTLQGRIDTGKGGTFQESGNFDVTITIRSAQYKGYKVSVDNNYLGTEGTGTDALDGIFTFKVAGNQQHQIRVDHPLNWKWWQYFYNAAESYSYDF